MRSTAAAPRATSPTRRPSWGSKGSGVDDRLRKKTYVNAAEAADRVTELQILFEGALVLRGKRLIREGPILKVTKLLLHKDIHESSSCLLVC